MCPDCGKPKMLFETERKANDFIRWNGDDLHVPEGCELRAYYCPSCCGWHISHQRHKKGYDTSTDRLIDAFNKSVSGKSRIDLLIHGEDTQSVAKKVFDNLPKEIRQAIHKDVIGKYLTAYFAEKGMNDSRRIRKAVYGLWEQQYRR